jgi:hypothetical protein
MSNCISGYTHAAINREVTLGGIYEGDKLVANFEIKQGPRLSQLLGRFNKPVPQVREKIIPVLREAGVTVSDDYWGARD